MSQCIIDFEKGRRCVITKVRAQGSLKVRLMSFGILRGVEVELLEFAPLKSTVELRIGKMRIALRKEEAELIEVECA